MHIEGKVIKDLEYSHTTLGEMFFKMTVGVPRLSGVVDEIPVIISERVPGIIFIKDQEMICLDGSFRSRNGKVGEKNKVSLYMFATAAMAEIPELTPNVVDVEGYICKKPIARITPTGREVADLIIAVNRGNGRCDYIPCIAWGRNAAFVENFNIGAYVQICGRMQSRIYQKVEEGQSVDKTAYELSVMYIQVVSSGDAV